MNIFSKKVIKQFTYSDEAFGNPLMGYAPWSWYESVSEDVMLIYMDITWRELEPTEGVFAWDAIAQDNQLDRWRNEGKHIVLRFVCDVPGDEEHMDIPDWLYEKIGGDGTKYHTTYGYGFSPNYYNETFIAYHKKAVEALGSQYGNDTFISFVELGSLGHWGEWHVNYAAGIGRIPITSVREQYVAPWLEAFPNAKIMMRRPFAEAKKYGLGIFNDMAGEPRATAEWLEWIENGGEYHQTGEKNAVVAMPDAWKRSPIGGEFTSSVPMRDMLVTNLPTTISLIRDSHTTFLGPKIAQREYREGYDAILSNMGYRLWISEMKLTPKFTGGVQLELTWHNSGVAPMYADWPVYLQVTDENHNIIETVKVDMTLSNLLPGTVIKTKSVLNKVEKWADLERYTIKLSIIDPMHGEAAVRFAVSNAKQYGNALVLWEQQ